MKNPKGKPAAQRQIMRTLEKGLLLLDTVCEAPEPLTLTELTERFPSDQGSIHRLLETLVRNKYLVRHYRSKKYSAGPRALTLNRAFERQNRIQTKLAPALIHLSKKYPTHVVSACVNCGTESAIVVLEYLNGDAPPYDIHQTGNKLPWHCTAHGKVLLAFQPPDLQEPIIEQADMAPYTESTLTDKAVLQAELLSIRKRGWASENQELKKYHSAIAAPILDTIGRAVASFAIQGIDYTANDISTLIEAAQAAGESLQPMP